MGKIVNVKVWRVCSKDLNSNHPGDQYHSYSSSLCFAPWCGSFPKLFSCDNYVHDPKF